MGKLQKWNVLESIKISNLHDLIVFMNHSKVETKTLTYLDKFKTICLGNTKVRLFCLLMNNYNKYFVSVTDMNCSSNEI